MAHAGITKENILHHIKIEVQEAFKTSEDLQDDWKKQQTNIKCVCGIFTKTM